MTEIPSTTASQPAGYMAAGKTAESIAQVHGRSYVVREKAVLASAGHKLRSGTFFPPF